MKKFTSLMLMLLCAVTTWGQTLITDAASLSNEKVYTLTPSNTASCGVICVSNGTESTQLCISVNPDPDITIDATDIAQRFAFITVGERTFMYSLGAQKFVADNETGQQLLSELNEECYVIFPASTGSAKDSYPLTVEVGGDLLCTTNSGWYTSYGGVVTNWYDTTDAGCMMALNEYEPTTAELELLETAYSTCEAYVNAKVNVVYEYYIGETLYHTSETISQDPGTFEIPELDYVTVVSYTPTEMTTSGTVKVTCEENLPFTASASYATATWYVVDIHSNENNYTWKYVAQDANVETPVTAKSQQTSLGDEYYWAFVGNLVDGFKIYNKAAGADLTLRKASNGNNASVMSATDDRNLFKLHASTAISGATCFKIADDSYYLNKQNQTLQGWTATDGGSSCRFFTPASFVINALGGAENAPSGAVGSYNYLADAANYNAFNDLYAPIKANQHDIEALVALDESGMVSEIVGGGTVAMTDGYYRIQNLFRPTDTDTKNIITVDATKGTRVAVISGLSDYNNVWQIASAGDGVYTIKNANNGKYMSTVQDNNLVEEANAGKYSFAEFGAAQWNIKCEGNNLVQYSSGSLGHWGSVAQNGDGAWYIIPATGVEVTVNEFASICLPFAVETTGDVKAYAVEGTNSTHALLAEKADIPANQGAILTGNGTFTLNIVDAVETDWAANQLVGTTVTTDVEAAANTTYYILANGDNGIGLYPDGLADGTFRNNANKAYLPVTSENAATGYSFVFDWAGTTGIEGVAAEGAQNGKIYDITGREVKAMTVPGLYIINGKKVVK